MNKKVGVTIGVIVVILGVVFIVRGTKSSNEYTPTITPPVTPTASSTPTVTTKSYTLAEIRAHSNTGSCWSAVNGKVYDLTTWIGQHPGGQQAIIGICGKDGSAAFNSQHGGMQKQADTLATFYIGELAK